MKSIKNLCEKQKQIHVLATTQGLLEWDQQCLMPRDGGSYRAEQMALLSRLRHEEETSSGYEDAVKAAEDETSALRSDHPHATLVRKTRRQLERKKKLPTALVEAITKASSIGHQTWEDARAQSDFLVFEPGLNELVRLVREKAKCVKTAESSLYDALLFEFDWGVTTQTLDSLFADVKGFLRDLIPKIEKPADIGPGVYNIEAQKQLATALAAQLGFKENNGLLFTSTHPFSITIGQGDYRITTRYNEGDFLTSFLGVAHEVGHSLYEQGLPAEHFGTALGEAASFGIHESQSLFWEKRVVTSRAFLQQWFPKFKAAFPASPIAKLNPSTFCNYVNAVEPTLIRVDADEVTYCFHIFIRYELEKDLISGALEVQDVPEAWNRKYQDYLGLTPPSAALGCLQDVHWAVSAFGYFPSYAMGHIFSAQFSEAFEKTDGPLAEAISGGRLPQILDWLRTKIHSRGSLLDPLDLVQEITGRPVSASSFCNYLKGKYT